MKPKTYSLYKVTNLISGKIYIGATNQTLADRMCGHRYDAKRRVQEHNSFYYDLRTLDRSNFSIFLVSSHETRDELFSAEVDLIAKLRKEGIDLYNVAAGGLNGNGGNKRSEEYKRRISGENGANVRMTVKQILEIRELYTSGKTQDEIANLYDMDQGRVSRIVNRKSWKFV